MCPSDVDVPTLQYVFIGRIASTESSIELCSSSPSGKAITSGLPLAASTLEGFTAQATLDMVPPYQQLFHFSSRLSTSFTFVCNCPNMCSSSNNKVYLISFYHVCRFLGEPMIYGMLQSFLSITCEVFDHCFAIYCSE
uniref:ZP domain-containing protein n=1 Tax=Ascaris lumbricoides TaxID=6252 RepID=A0A0M3IVP2_ASCLU